MEGLGQSSKHSIMMERSTRKIWQRLDDSSSLMTGLGSVCMCIGIQTVITVSIQTVITVG